MEDGKRYAVFRKAFHIPRVWLDKEDIVFLVNHMYATTQAEEALSEIVRRLKRLGYMRTGDGDRMVHDYLCFFIQDLLDKNDEIYLTEEEIRGSESILRFFEGKTPDLLVKTKAGREKPLIVEVYTGSRDAALNPKSKYKAFGSVTTLVTVHPNSMLMDLSELLPPSDLAYLHRHFQVFMTEYQYWKSCVSLETILKNDVACVPVSTDSVPRDLERTAAFASGMRAYAESVLNRSNI
jgi:hypothetical protein